MSCFIRQALALCAFERKGSALHVVHAKLLAVAVAEIELAQIAMQMGFAHVLINAVHAAFQDREESFYGVGVSVAAHVFVGIVLDGAVRCKIPADGGKRCFLIGHELAFGRSMAAQNRVQGVGANVRHVEGPCRAVTLDQRQNRPHVAGAGVNLGSRLAANIGQVRLKGTTFTSHRRANAILGRLHDFADSMGQEPSGLHAAIEGPLNLAGRDALLACGNELDGLEPQVQREMAVLEDAADPHGDPRARSGDARSQEALRLGSTAFRHGRKSSPVLTRCSLYVLIHPHGAESRLTNHSGGDGNRFLQLRSRPKGLACRVIRIQFWSSEACYSVRQPKNPLRRGVALT